MSESAKDHTIKLPPQDDRAVPTLEEIEQALQAWNYFHRYSESVTIVRRLRDLLKSGEYALISRADRETALALSGDAARLLAARIDHRSSRMKARTLLQLQETR